MNGDSRKESVAIIGSGPAGLCAAYFLRRSGYEVVVYEKAQYVALAGHSYRLAKDDTQAKPEHASSYKPKQVKSDDPSSIVIDIPLRVFSGGYYTNWWRLLNHLGVEANVHRFHYAFTDTQNQYAQFFSNFHKILPCLKNGIFINLYLGFWYLWFTFACFWIAPRTSVGSNYGLIETFDEYVQRIKLPKRFVNWYVLPLFSSVATCTHDDLLQIPAAYIINYRKGTYGSHHRTVDMDTLERYLTEGVTIKMGQTVLSVVTQDDGRVQVEHTTDPHSGSDSENTKFDHVILAISAAESSKIHRASAPITNELRTRKVCVKLYRPGDGTLSPNYKEISKEPPSEMFQLDTQKTDFDDLLTHSTHHHPAGMVVNVSPQIDECSNRQHGVPDEVDHTVNLMRPLVTPQSHALLQDVFTGTNTTNPVWRNGDGNVYIASGFTSGGLPLLEACVRSALESTIKIGAKPPFEVDRKTTF